jgi:transposase InsO family protein
MNDSRKEITGLIQEACDAGARQLKACQVIDISTKTYQRWCRENNKGDGRLYTKRTPHNKLTALERQRIINTANEDAYADLSPAKLTPTLADKGIYIGSESTIYRILKSEALLKHRLKSKMPRKVEKPIPLIAKKPNEIYSWDITYLPTNVRGIFYYLYLVLDIYSRKIVGWQVYDNESSALAADLIKDICKREKIRENEVALHSDNGSPMKGATMLATLQELGIMPSFSRPSVSNDNPYSESLFNTCKSRSNYPEKPFESLVVARTWVDGFAKWYNDKHLHSAIKFVTPAQRHAGEDKEVLALREQVYLKAKRKHPNRWSGDIRNWDMIGAVYLNPEKQKNEVVRNKAA